MATHRHDGNEISTELETLFGGMGLPVADTDDRTKATGILVTSAGSRAASIEWLVSTSARSAAAREQIEGLADGRAGLLHRAAHVYIHHALTGILQELGYSVAQLHPVCASKGFRAFPPGRRPPAASPRLCVRRSTTSTTFVTASETERTAMKGMTVWPVCPPACNSLGFERPGVHGLHRSARGGLPRLLTPGPAGRAGSARG
ncbi:hypothetical protein ABZ953_08230 [Streptomyces sp. NPDC046465]|uniref:hypothetical protein n=1 Tax=Streptomyces sp. NPDC046465 TaxID=3155810 RepID=UPI003403B6F9